MTAIIISFVFPRFIFNILFQLIDYRFKLHRPMQRQPQKQEMLKVSDFISIATQLAYSACEIIKEASQNAALQKYQKGYDDPVTEADYHVQTMIISGLRKFFPHLRVIGEETVDYKGKITVDYECFAFDSYPQKAQFKDLFVPIEQLCVWIDPIDCTKGFIKKEMHFVTNLIGMSRNKQAFLGVIGVPYKRLNDTTNFDPSVTIGVIQTRQAYRFTKQTKWTQIHPQPTENPPRIITTKSRVCQKYNELTTFIKGEHLFGQGSGFKLMSIINGESDLFLYLSHHTSKWDSCAGEAIIKALGGYVLTKKNESIVYDPDQTDHRNHFGLVCSLHQELFQKTYAFLKQQ